jgi:hypothetical protein
MPKAIRGQLAIVSGASLGDEHQIPIAIAKAKRPHPSENRRLFIGGSDARIIMGKDEPLSSASGRRSGAKPSRKTSPTT